MKGEFLFLGTGGSTGIPMISCECAVCRSHNPNNTRLRPSGLVSVGGKKIVIDTGPDFRAQALAHDLNHIDGVILTHTHFDHIAGLDELRTYYLLHRQVIPLLVSETSYADLKRRYDYLFREKEWGISLSAQLDMEVFSKERGELDFVGLKIGVMTYEQGGMKVNGFRFGNFAYVSDIRHYPDTIFEDLAGVETLVVSALRHEPSPMHLTVNEAVEFARKVGAQSAFFTHIAHELDHETTNAELPEGFALAYDGQQLTFEM